MQSDVALLLAEAIRRRLRLRVPLHSRSRASETTREGQPAGALSSIRAAGPRRVRPRPRRPAHLPRRPDEPRRGSRRRVAGAAAGGSTRLPSVRRSLARVPWRWEVVVVLDRLLDEAARRVPATVAELVEEGAGRTQLRMRVGSLDWMAAALARLGCRFHDPGAGGASRERPRARHEARGVRRRRMMGLDPGGDAPSRGPGCQPSRLSRSASGHRPDRDAPDQQPEADEDGRRTDIAHRAVAEDGVRTSWTQ